MSTTNVKKCETKRFAIPSEVVKHRAVGGQLRVTKSWAIELIEFDNHINDAVSAEAASNRLLAMIQACATPATEDLVVGPNALQACGWPCNAPDLLRDVRCRR